MAPVPAFAAGHNWITTQSHARIRTSASASGDTTVSRPGRTPLNCTGAVAEVYVTPVNREEVGVALISSNPKLRLGTRMDDALEEFPELCARLKDADLASSKRGAITVTRKLRRVYRDRTVLVGDASGGVDAITGEGLCLAFRQPCCSAIAWRMETSLVIKRVIARCFAVLS